MATFNMNALQVKSKSNPAAGKDEKKAAKFRAGNLEIVIRDATTGETVVEAVLKPQGFKAGPVKKKEPNGPQHGGVGWYGQVTSESGGLYRGIGINGGLRISLDGLKFDPTDTVDIRTDEEKAVDADLEAQAALEAETSEE